MNPIVCSEVKNAVVVGRNYGNILSMVRALGRAGYSVDILRLYKTKPRIINFLSSMKPDAVSKYIDDYEECIVENERIRAVRMLLDMNQSSDRRLLIPVDDYSCGIIDENLIDLQRKYILPEINGKQGGIIALMDKNIQKKLAYEAGVPILKSVLIKSEGTNCEIPKDIPFPCFVKPNVSMNDTKSRMTKCDNMEQLGILLSDYASKGGFELLAEEFADIKNEYSLLGISDGDVVYAPGLFRAEKSGHRERKGVAMTGVTCDIDKFGPFINKCKEYIASLNFKGLFDIDIVETTDGMIYFIEVNFRAGASVHVFTDLGINMPGMYADRMVRSIPFNMSFNNCESGKRFLSEKILLEEFARNDISKKELKMHLKSADVLFIKDEDDPKPYKVFKRHYFTAWLMRLPYRIRDRRNGNNAR